MNNDMENMAGISNNFLKPSGWHRSYKEERPVTLDGQPLPWFTYGAIEFLNRVIKPTDNVFEYGAGFSTLWWQEHAKSVTSVDHDRDWINELSPKLAENVNLQHIDHTSKSNEYCKDIIVSFNSRKKRNEWDYPQDKIVRRGLDDDNYHAYASEITKSDILYDIIIIDGMARRLCAEFAVSKLNNHGIIILDNSNRSDYDAAFDILSEHGFYQIPFWGLVPGATFLTCTSFFLKSLKRLPKGNHVPNSFGLPEY